MAEALRAEVVGDAALGNFGGTGVEVRVADVDASNANDESVTGERAARELARVGVGFEDVEFGVADFAPGLQGELRLRDREPLDGDRAAVFQAGVTDVAGVTAAEFRELARYPLGVGVSLADFEQHVLAGAGGCEAEVLFDDEVLGFGAENAASEGCAKGARVRAAESQVGFKVRA